MKNCLLFFICLICISCFSQEYQKYLDLKIVNYNNDTLISKIKMQKDIFSGKPVDNIHYYGILKLIDNDGNIKYKIKIKDVKELYFKNLEGENKIYFNDGKDLKELKFSGAKLKWFITISRNLYDGSIQYHDQLVDNNGEIYYLSIFRMKQRLKEATKSKPELAKFIDDTVINNVGILKILKKYEEL